MGIGDSSTDMCHAPAGCRRPWRYCAAAGLGRLCRPRPGPGARADAVPGAHRPVHRVLEFADVGGPEVGASAGGPLPRRRWSATSAASWASAPRSRTSPVEIYVLDNRQDFDHFLKFYYPELPSRRAFFLAKGTQRLVYTYVEPPARGGPAARGDARPAPRRLRRPAALARRGTGRVLRDRPRPAGRPAPAPRADRRGPARAMVARTWSGSSRSRTSAR